MKRVLLLPAAMATLFLAGCYYDEPVNAPPPPPPPAYSGNQTPALIQLAQRNGYRAGFDDGARDNYYRAGYDPQHDVNYQDAPGYDYRLGPIHPYVDAYREAYLRGYERGFYRDRGR